MLHTSYVRTLAIISNAQFYGRFSYEIYIQVILDMIWGSKRPDSRSILFGCTFHGDSQFSNSFLSRITCSKQETFIDTPRYISNVSVVASRREKCGPYESDMSRVNKNVGRVYISRVYCKNSKNSRLLPTRKNKAAWFERVWLSDSPANL